MLITNKDFKKILNNFRLNINAKFSLQILFLYINYSQINFAGIATNTTVCSNCFSLSQVNEIFFDVQLSITNNEKAVESVVNVHSKNSISNALHFSILIFCHI